MNISKRAAVATLTAAALAGSATTAVTAVAHQSGHIAEGATISITGATLGITGARCC